MAPDITDDEGLKAACHGLFLGCLLPVLAYNLRRGKVLNSVVYLALGAFEVAQILTHLRDSSDGS